VQRIALSREPLSEIRITLPVGTFIAIRDAGEPGVRSAIVPREPTMRKRISIRIANRLAWDRCANEVSLLIWFAPGALGVPVPCLYGKFRIVAIGNGLPARGKRSAEIWFRQSAIDSLWRNAVNPRTKGLTRPKVICGMSGSDIDFDGLRCRHGHENNEYKKIFVKRGYFDQEITPWN